MLYIVCPRTVPDSKCSELYRRYSDVPGIEATYVKDYPVNDTLSIGVTILQATDSTGWGRLQKGFSVPMPEDSTEILALNRGGDILALIPNEKISIPMEPSDIVTSSYRDKNVYIFHAYNMNDKANICRLIFLYKIKQLNQAL